MTDRHHQFKSRLLLLQEVIMSGLLFHAVWNKIRLHDATGSTWSIEEQSQVLGRWSGLFTPVGIGLQRMALIEFFKVFDRDNRAASLVNLLRDAREDRSLVPYAQPDDLREVSERLQRGRSTVATLKKLRDQRLAHVDAKPDTLPPLMSQKIDSLIEDIKFAFNRLSTMHDNSYYSWESALRQSNDHTSHVLELLLKELQRSRTERDETIAEIILGISDASKQLLDEPSTMKRSLESLQNLAPLPVKNAGSAKNSARRNHRLARLSAGTLASP